jgi:dCTP deaminase
MRIGQISFLKMSSAVERPYGSRELGSKYQGQSSPTESQVYRDFEGEGKAHSKGGPRRG